MSPLERIFARCPHPCPPPFRGRENNVNYFANSAFTSVQRSL